MTRRRSWQDRVQKSLWERRCILAGKGEHAPQKAQELLETAINDAFDGTWHSIRAGKVAQVDGELSAEQMRMIGELLDLLPAEY